MYCTVQEVSLGAGLYALEDDAISSFYLLIKYTIITDEAKCHVIIQLSSAAKDDVLILSTKSSTSLVLVQEVYRSTAVNWRTTGVADQGGVLTDFIFDTSSFLTRNFVPGFVIFSVSGSQSQI